MILIAFFRPCARAASSVFGGAAFPVWAKLDAVRRNKIKTVLINGAECEPYITSDDRTMVEHSELIKQGVALQAVPWQRGSSSSALRRTSPPRSRSLSVLLPMTPPSL